MFIFRFDGDN